MAGQGVNAFGLNRLLKYAYNASTKGHVGLVEKVQQKAERFWVGRPEVRERFEKLRVRAHLKAAIFDREKAATLVDDLEASGVDLTLREYTSILNVLASKRMPHEAMVAWDRMLKAKLKPDELAYCRLLDVFVNTGRITEAYEVLETMKRVGISPSVETYNHFLKVVVSKKFFDYAQHLLFEMIERGLRPDQVSYNTIISSAARSGNHRVVKKVQDRLKEVELKEDPYTHASLVKVHVSNNDLKGSQSAFRRIQRAHESEPVDVKVWNALLEGYMLLSSLEEALFVFSKMTSQGVKPTIDTYTILLRGFVREDRFHKAAALLEEVERDGLEPTPAMYGILIQAQAAKGKFELVTYIRERMQAHGTRMTPATYEHLLQAYASAGRFQDAEDTFEEMDRVCCLTAPAYEHMLQMYAEMQLSSRMLSILQDMLHEGIEPSAKAKQLFQMTFLKGDTNLYGRSKLRDEVIAISGRIEELQRKRINENARFKGLAP